MKTTENLFVKCFGVLEDPRMDRRKRHNLLDIIAITVCAVIAGADGWTDVVRFGRAKEDWLRSFLELENGIPSHDTFGRFFSLLDPSVFQGAFQSWVAAIQQHVQGVVAIDGKTVRRSHDRANAKQAIHIVSAWAGDCALALGQVKVEDKSNEIKAIPQLLKLLNLKGCLVTIDAMGCQRDIAKNIIEAHAGYLLALKGNQELLAEDVEQEFKHAMAENFAHMEHHYHETIDKAHGRVERRQYWYTQDIHGLGTAGRWPGLAGMIMCRATRTVNQETSIEDRYYITSERQDSAIKLAAAVRAHWGIENSLHWVLDVTFNEDQSRVRIGHAAENLATIRKMALNVMKNDGSNNDSIRGKRKRAGWDDRYLEQLLLKM
ncbi:MAG: ISAs1 family transposase [Candidatus Hydrogenedentes bacterium]|nr:ISAs1 family transposase [Candidatus Hydrogenedentota bacterium]